MDCGTSNKKSSRKRTFNRISTDGETESPVEYDELKNTVIDIQLSAKEFRKSLKHVKSDDPKYEKILLDLERHLKEDLHVHVNKLNTRLSVTTQEEGDLREAVRVRNNEVTSLKKNLDNYEKKLKYYEELDKNLKIKNDENQKLDKLLKDSDEKCRKLLEDKESTLHHVQEKEREIEVLRSEREEARRIQDSKAFEVENRQQTINTLEKQVESIQGENEQKIKSLQHELHDLEQRLKQEQEEAISNVNKLKNEKQLVIDHFTQQVQSRDNEIQRLRGEIQQLSESNGHYEQYYRQTQEELQSFKSELERKENTLQTVVKQRDEERTLKEDERKQKDEALTRLSAIAGDRLRNNNPGITDLSDPNRPMKIAEKFTEMYDNDWTDSMEALEELDLGEEECVKILLHFLTDSYEECGRLVAELDSHILKAVIISTCEEDTNESYNGTTLSSKTFGLQTINSEYKCILVDLFEIIPQGSLLEKEDNKPQDQNIPAELLKPMKDLRKKLTENNVEKLQKKLPDYLMKTRDLTEEHITACSKFVTDCIKYAWMMQIQDPPVYIEWDFPSDTKIDTNILRSYTKAGDHVDFIVWPVLYLHKDGPVLNKGVVQPKSANK